MHEENRIGTLIFSDRELPLAVKAIASDPKIRETTSFGLVSDRNKEVLKQFNSKKYPTMVSFVAVGDEGGLRFSEYPGEMTNYAEMQYFLEQLASEFYQRKIEISAEELEDEEVDEFTAKVFKHHCLKQGGICAIAMLDGDAEATRNRKYVKTLKKIKAETAKKNIPITFGWIDGFCQFELRNAFNI
jgi:hypothetical protein